MSIDRFFVVAGRINTVLFMLMALGVAAVLSYFALEKVFSRGAGPALLTEKNPGAKEPTRLQLGMSRDVNGADTTMTELTTEGYYGNLKSGNSGGETRNVLLVTGPDKKTSWLFKNHQNLILDLNSVQKVESDLNDPALAVYVLYVPADTDGDGELSHYDNAVIALAKPDGSGFLPVVQGVNHVLSREVRDGNQLSFVYRRGTTLRHATFSLARFKLETDKEIFNISAR